MIIWYSSSLKLLKVKTKCWILVYAVLSGVNRPDISHESLSWYFTLKEKYFIAVL